MAKPLPQIETTIQKLNEYFSLCQAYYLPDQRKMRVLDATDKSNLWKALNAQFPPYQILPDTNFVSYVKNNLLASIYTVAKSAEVVPTSEKDKDLVVNLNVALEHIWKNAKVGFYQFQAGERAALCNLGITQVGWDESITGGTGDTFFKGNVALKNIDPLKFMRDPFAVDLDSSQYCMVYEQYHKSVLMKNPNYRERLGEYLRNKDGASMATPIPDKYDALQRRGAAQDYHTLHIFWVRERDKIHEVHVIDMMEIIYIKADIQPAMFPFCELYCNLPTGSLIGTSECQKIFANNVAYNLMDSIALTAEYKNQRPPKFINSASGLNIKAFIKNGNEADQTFVVNGDATKAVHYHQFPFTSPNMGTLKQSLMMGIESMSGVDRKYTGRDTGSIITTGGVEDMLNRATLIDTPKITNYEDYTMRLTKLILWNFVEFSPKRKYFVKKPNSLEYHTVEIDFPKIESKTLFDYEIDISSQLPSNKARVANMANELMKAQRQYGQQGGVDLITEEEWLMFQDIPRKEYMLKRMGVQRLQDALENTAQTLFQYADLVKKGMSPDDAIAAVAQTMDQKRQGNDVETNPMMPPPPAMMPQGGAPGGMPPMGPGGVMPPAQTMPQDPVPPGM